MSDPKGISICIPIYNQDVRKLIQTLFSQSTQLPYAIEIRCYDDCSNEEFKSINKEIIPFKGVIYKELDKNIGRSKIRNLLARESAYSHLLFLDCDSQVTQSSFLFNYATYLNHDVVIGGRIYPLSPPSKEYILHWKMGKLKEEANAAQRSLAPYENFMSNNFLIRKELFLQITMDENLKGYGHEDTKFGYELGENNIEIIHIDNSVVHENLDNTEDFLNKTAEGIKNFYKILKEGYGKRTKLAKSYTLIHSLLLTSLYLFIYSLLSKKIQKNLRSISPSPVYFDMYKLYLLFKEEKLATKK